MKTFKLTESEMIMLFTVMAGITVKMKEQEISDHLEAIARKLKAVCLDNPRLAIAKFLDNNFMPFGEPTTTLIKKVKNLLENQASIIEFMAPETANPSQNNDPIDPPSHYTWLKDEIGVEPIDICEHFNFNIGSALKYLMRAGRKRENDSLTLAQNAYKDLMKAATFCKREAENQLSKCAECAGSTVIK